MATDPERPIEKLLRACAKKRGEAAGAPPELHPATRRLLQGEVARRFGGEQRQAASQPMPRAWFWPRLAWGLAIVAVLAVAATVLLPSLARSKSKGLLAKNETLRERKSASQPPTPTLAAQPAPLAAEADGRLDSVKLKLADNEKRARSETAAAPGDERLESDKDRAFVVGEAVAEEKVGRVAGSTRNATVAGTPAVPAESLFARRAAPAGGPAQTIMASAAPASPLPAASSGQALTKTASAVAAWSNAANQTKGQLVLFNQAPQKAPGLVHQAAPRLAVLASFQVEQQGQQLRVVDSDGSVYAGPLQLANTPSQLVAAKAEPAAALDSFQGAQRQRDQAPAPKKPANQQFQAGYAFRVVGTNRSLNQNVIFTGNVLPANDAVGFAWTTTNLEQSLNAPATGSLPLLNSRISGKAQIGDQEEIQIEAAPASP